MSRIGTTPIEIPTGVTVTVTGATVTVNGPKGSLNFVMPDHVRISVEGPVAVVSITGESRKMQAKHGLVRATIANMVKGVSVGWAKTLELSGVGYRAAVTGADLVLNVGFSHQVTVKAPAGITFAITEGKIVVSGNDRQKVGQVAAQIREIKKPEPYKGKGIKYSGEHIRKKAGKTAKAVGGAK